MCFQFGGDHGMKALLRGHLPGGAVRKNHGQRRCRFCKRRLRNETHLALYFQIEQAQGRSAALRFCNDIRVLSASLPVSDTGCRSPLAVTQDTFRPTSHPL